MVPQQKDGFSLAEAVGEAPWHLASWLLSAAATMDSPKPNADNPKPSAVAGPPPNAGRAIRAWRRRVGLTQEGLAEALSVTFSTVSRWENGHVRPSKLAWRALQQLATERGCPLEIDGN